MKKSKNIGKGFGVNSIVFGVLSMFILPIVFGPLGIIFGVSAIKNGYKRVGIIGVILNLVVLFVSLSFGFIWIGLVALLSFF